MQAQIIRGKISADNAIGLWHSLWGLHVNEVEGRPERLSKSPAAFPDNSHLATIVPLLQTASCGYKAL